MKLFINILLTAFVLVSMTLFFSCTGDDDDNTVVPLPANSFKDNRDGNIYKYVQIGDQVWMAENLRYKASSGSYFYNDDPGQGANYGMLYTLSAARKSCPAGWHLPSDEEWKQLEQFLGMTKAESDKTGFRGTGEAEKLMSGGDTGFNLQFGGLRTKSGIYAGIGIDGEYWTSTSSLEGYKAFNREFRKDNPKIYREDNVVGNALSVRCIRD